MPDRPRLFHERVELEQRQHRGDPIEFDVIPKPTLAKMAHWIAGDILGEDLQRCSQALIRLQRAMGTLPGKGDGAGRVRFIVQTAEPKHVWSLVESAVTEAFRYAIDDRYVSEERVKAFRATVRNFNTFLGDEFIGYQLAPNENGDLPPFIIRRIDSELLHREVVDRTFEITRVPEFATANGHYSQAWKHFSKGDHPDAITNAAKAMESALKVLLTKLDPGIRTDNLSASDLFRELFKREFLPDPMRPLLKHLRAIYEQAVPPLRNDSAHGDVKPFEPDASLTLLVLNLVGSLIIFAVQAHSSR